ncbi:hypothetical protein [Candidatus Lokiarchaeum ossiferum]|uniref:hypothetical protein n=1 Tax=Candidatus Lokiarchaeum ossiferum TaxID=2951803 RepID=UPI00352C6A7B
MLANDHQLLLPVILKAKEDPEIIGMMLYGSADKNSYYNDVDIALFLKNKLSPEQMFQKRLLFLAEAPEKLDIQIFNLLPLTIQHNVIAGSTLYETEAMYELVYRTIREFEDFERYQKEYLEVYMNDHRTNH